MHVALSSAHKDYIADKIENFLESKQFKQLLALMSMMHFKLS